LEVLIYFPACWRSARKFLIECAIFLSGLDPEESCGDTRQLSGVLITCARFSSRSRQERTSMSEAKKRKVEQTTETSLQGERLWWRKSGKA
jgi:hypothetical protein